jgi:tRNA(Ile)-lysidine synthase
VALEVVRERRPGPSAGPAAPAAAASASASGPAPGNLQAWAREVRYREAERVARGNDALVATGHTASDQVETILYRLAASPGRRALLGMVASEGRLVRPLLGVTREQTTAYCEARGLAWREDSSNEDQRYARSRVRHGLLEALRAVHPAAEANVLRTAELLRAETQLLDALVSEELAGASGIAIERLEQLPAALARMVVVRLAEEAAGTYVPQAGERVPELIELGRRRGRSELHVGGRAGAVIEDGVLGMVKLPPRTQAR